LNFPDHVKDYDFKNLMQHMLDKNLETRYSKFEDISGHIYFKDFNWDELISLNMEPAYIPKLKKLDSKYTPKPYVDYVKTLEDWEPPQNMSEPERLKRIEFNEWFKKF
jgi:serine/threonine protein kinase